MDPVDFEDVYHRFAAVVYGRCLRILRDTDTARDITQEVFIRCLRRRDELRPGRELLAWLYRVATNLCLNLLRDRKFQRMVDASLGQSRTTCCEEPSRCEVLDLLDGLDERTQAIAVYVYVDGMTQAEAAHVAQVSDRTVRNCLVRFAEHGRRRAGTVLGAGSEGGKA